MNLRRQLRLGGGVMFLNRTRRGRASQPSSGAALMLLLALALALPVTGRSAAPLADTSMSPHARVRPVGLDEAHWAGGFWGDRLGNLRTNMLPAMTRLMEASERSQYLENFRIAAGLVEGRPKGAPFNDGDYYKLLEAASAVVATTRDLALTEQLDRVIEVIARAQRPDGYLHTPVLIRARLGDTNAAPFRDRNNFEMYNMGHLITAACLHHRATGRTNLLHIARKAANFLDATMAGASPDSARSSVCPSHYMALVELWRLTREPRYLALARRFLELRSRIAEGGDDNQDRVPLAQQTRAVGHAVRANYLYAGAADLYLETGDASVWSPLGTLWTNVVTTKMHVTGGCGALYDGASPDGSRDQKSITRTHQAYGRDYQLPNTTAHNETCAAIGSVLWNWRMFLATGDARHVDVLEQALYNAVAAGVGLDGTNFFYTNPLRVTDPMPVELRWSRTRVPYVSSFCCPPNVLRTFAESAAYAYGTTPGALWINLYGPGSLRTHVGSGTVELEQETNYPWDGRVRIRIRDGGRVPFAIRMRIPGWSSGATLRVNGENVGTAAVRGTYAEVVRPWRAGDVLELDLPMPVVLLEANPLAEEVVNQLAVRRGPIVYCLESADLPTGVRVGDVLLPDDVRLEARFDRALLGGCAVLEGEARVRRRTQWEGELYREARREVPGTVPIRMIPYSLWANRGAGEMSVWLPRAVASGR